MKNIYLVRHCEAEGQSAEAQLSERGDQQALDLSAFFHSIQVIVLYPALISVPASLLSRLPSA